MIVQKIKRALYDIKWIESIAKCWIQSLSQHCKTIHEIIQIFKNNFLDENVIRPINIRIFQNYIQLIGSELVIPNSFLSIKWKRIILNDLLPHRNVLFESCQFDKQKYSFSLTKFRYNANIHSDQFIRKLFHTVKHIINNHIQIAHQDHIVENINTLIHTQWNMNGLISESKNKQVNMKKKNNKKLKIT